MRRLPAVVFIGSEGLAEADIDLDRGIGVALVQRRRQVEAQRPERGVIARPYAYAVKQRAAELRHRAIVIAAGINKGTDTDLLGDLDAGFKVEHQARPPADRVFI